MDSSPTKLTAQKMSQMLVAFLLDVGPLTLCQMGPDKVVLCFFMSSLQSPVPTAVPAAFQDRLSGLGPKNGPALSVKIKCWFCDVISQISFCCSGACDLF